VKRYHLSAILSTVAIISIPGMALAVPWESTYPVAQPNSNLACYMESENGNTLDLSKICGIRGNAYPFRGGDSDGGSYNNGASFSSGSDSRAIGSFTVSCLYSDDRAADGTRCGARAARDYPDGSTNVSAPLTASEAIEQNQRAINRTFEQNRRSIDETFGSRAF
jgi:hypothetical protein